MPKLNIIGWREGLLKISMTDLLQEHLSLTLTDAKATVDAVVAGQTASFILDTEIDATLLRDQLEHIGAIVELEADDEPLSAASQGET
jgi:hypothetical protein